jgi:hypothetical protein
VAASSVGAYTSLKNSLKFGVKFAATVFYTTKPFRSRVPFGTQLLTQVLTQLRDLFQKNKTVIPEPIPLSTALKIFVPSNE